MLNRLKTEALPITASQDLNDELIIILQGLHAATQVLILPELGLRFNEERKLVADALDSCIRLTQLADEILQDAEKRGLRGNRFTTKRLLTQSD